MFVGSSHVWKMQKQPFPVRGGSKTFENWGEGVIKFRTGGVTFEGGSVPHYIPWLFQISHNCVTECTLQARFMLKV